MIRSIIISALSLTAILCVLSSCKRKENIQTRYTRLQNKWKLVKTATDGNNNGVIDVSEIQDVNEGYRAFVQYKGDSTGTETVTAGGLTTVYPFRWTFEGNITIIQDRVGNNVIEYKLEDISSLAMELSTITALGLTAYYYERQ